MFPGVLPRGCAVIETAGNSMRSSFFYLMIYTALNTHLAISSKVVLLRKSSLLRVNGHFVFCTKC